MFNSFIINLEERMKRKKQIFYIYLFSFFFIRSFQKIRTVQFLLSISLSLFRHCHPIISRHIYIKKKTRDNHTCMHARTRDHRIGMADKTTTTTSYHRSLVSFSSLKCPHRRCSISHLSILCMHTHT
jgi:hypothetical protein